MGDKCLIVSFFAIIDTSTFKTKKAIMEPVYNIPKDRMDNVMSIYWQMLKHMEQDAYESKNTLDRMLVEGAFQVWNGISHDNHEPLWKNKQK